MQTDNPKQVRQMIGTHLFKTATRPKFGVQLTMDCFFGARTELLATKGIATRSNKKLLWASTAVRTPCSTVASRGDLQLLAFQVNRSNFLLCEECLFLWMVFTRFKADPISHLCVDAFVPFHWCRLETG